MAYIPIPTEIPCESMEINRTNQNNELEDCYRLANRLVMECFYCIDELLYKRRYRIYPHATDDENLPYFQVTKMYTDDENNNTFMVCGVITGTDIRKSVLLRSSKVFKIKANAKRLQKRVKAIRNAFHRNQSKLERARRRAPVP